MVKLHNSKVATHCEVVIKYQGSVTHACNESSRYNLEKLMVRKSYTDRALEISKENQDKDSMIFWQQAVDHIDSLILKQGKMNRLKNYWATFLFLSMLLLMIVFMTPCLVIISLLVSVLNKESPIASFKELSNELGFSSLFKVKDILCEINKINKRGRE